MKKKVENAGNYTEGQINNIRHVGKSEDISVVSLGVLLFVLQKPQFSADLKW